MSARTLRLHRVIVCVGFAAALSLAATCACAGNILFIGNSFTYGQGSAVRYYRAQSVTDLNGLGIGGVPALFKSFMVQAGVNVDVFLETQPAVGLEWHLEHKEDVIGRQPWDAVVLQSYSTLDIHKPGDATVLIASVGKMAELFRMKNPAVQIRLTATWPRADQTYLPDGAWYGKTIDAMAHDVRLGYDKAAATPGIKGVMPVGDAWVRAMHTGVADANPYDGNEAGKLNLWTFDNYHASTYGYYLTALVVFGSVSGRDPRSLSDAECSGFELGLSRTQVGALEQVAFDQLNADRLLAPVKSESGSATLKEPAKTPARCGEIGGVHPGSSQR